MCSTHWSQVPWPIREQVSQTWAALHNAPPGEKKDAADRDHKAAVALAIKSLL